MLKKLLPLALLLLNACASPQLYSSGDVAHEILRSRAGHDGKLTFQTCGAYNKQTCTQMTIKEYDLSQQAVRTELRQDGFVCKMGGHQYKICADQDGFCRTTSDCNWFTGIFGCQPTVTFLPANPMPDIKCFSPSVYDWDSIN